MKRKIKKFVIEFWFLWLPLGTTLLILFAPRTWRDFLSGLVWGYATFTMGDAFRLKKKYSKYQKRANRDIYVIQEMTKGSGLSMFKLMHMMDKSSFN